MAFYKELLEGLEKEGFNRSNEGFVKKEEQILDEIHFELKCTTREEVSVQVATDKHFTVNYIVDKNNTKSYFALETSYSNQPVSRKWLDRANGILELINNQ